MCENCYESTFIQIVPRYNYVPISRYFEKKLKAKLVFTKRLLANFLFLPMLKSIFIFGYYYSLLWILLLCTKPLQ